MTEAENTGRVEFRVSPDQYKHWKLSADGPVATLTMDVDEQGGLVPGYELKLNSYDLGVDIELYDAVQRLRWAGFGNVMPGVWLSPRSDRGGEVRQILDEAGLPDGYLFTAEHQGGGSLAAMVGQAWDLDQLSREYDEFIEAFSGEAGSDPLVRVIDLVHAWRRFPWIDPGLPARFLPAPWPGTAAAGLFARRHAEWTGDAIAEWKQLLARP